MAYNILITGTSSYGVGEGLLKVLYKSAYRDQLRLIGASNSELSAYKHLVSKYYVLPSVGEDNYYEQLCRVVREECVHIVIPGSEAEMLFFSRNKERIEFELNVDIWVNKYEIIETFDDKSRAEAFFKKNHFNTPPSYEENRRSFPIVIKPTHGKSSEGIFIVHDKKQYEAVIELYRTLEQAVIVQQFIEKDREFTVSLINLGVDVEILCMERILNKGATQYAKIVPDACVIEMSQRLHSVLGNEIILNLQIIQQGDDYYCIEVNPRFSGSASMRADLGFNEFDILFAYKYLGRRHMYNLKQDAYCIRGYQEFVYGVE